MRHLESLEIDDSGTLTGIRIISSNLKKLKLGRITKLKYLRLDCKSLFIDTFNLSGSAELESLDLGVVMNRLDVSECSNLSNLALSYSRNSLIYLCASGCSALSCLSVPNFSNLSYLDISDCTGLSSLNIDGCTSLYGVSACGLKCGTYVYVDGLWGIVCGYDGSENAFPRVISSSEKFGSAKDCSEWLSGRWGFATSNDLANGIKYSSYFNRNAISEGENYWVISEDGDIKMNKAGQTYERRPTGDYAKARAVFAFRYAFY